MNVQNQIKNYRKHHGFSQDDLADHVFVSRQTISNWETGKSYPDIHSLLLLSTVFNISIDELIKGDVENMKEFISKADMMNMKKWSFIYSGLFIAMLVSLAPLYHYWREIGVAIWAVLSLVTIGIAFKVEKLKKIHDVQTYKEIVAFMDGKKIDELRKERNKWKMKMQNIFFMLLSAGIAFGVVYVLMMILEG